MSLLGQFAAPVGAMMAQSKAMQVIGTNIANMNTGGYKRSETTFYSMISKTYGYNRDIGGVNGITRQLVDQQGQILGSDSNLDVAINGNGFFVLNSELDGSGQTFYGRDGMLGMALGNQITTTINGNTYVTREGYVVDKNGYYVQGWPVNADQETFPTDAGSLGAMRIDPETFTNNGEATTTAEIGLNVPSNAPVGYQESTFIKAFNAQGEQVSYQLRWTNIVLGSNTQTAAPNWALPGGEAAGFSETNEITTYNNRGYEKRYNLQWTKSANPGEWTLSVLEGSDSLSSTTVTFDPVTGDIVSPTSVNVQGTGDWDDAFSLDLSAMSQPVAGAGPITQTGFTQDGVVAAAEKNKYSLEILENGVPLTIDSASGDTTPGIMTVVFNESGKIQSPINLTIAGTAADAPTFTLDMQKITNYASGTLVEGSYDYNGRSNARLSHVSFNAAGEMIGHFADATTRPIYKLPLATFTNPNSLDPVNGNVFRLSGTTSEPVIRTAGGQGAGQFVPNAREISNVDMADEFTSMILTQKAYNMGSTTFKTIDEMSQVARDLKR
ncbi:flagellar hook-basal body complex protein [Terasakiella pusilla]|uniref:flagellar hook-basal body complex protein n=1 Tax=Terasakiella pusilla TaxID=64973 RepID=UPI00048AF5B7|nr:flagellar hook-basal body complex protein [Terasakiella pusilla]